MKCDRCGKNEATFYYKSNINGRVTETHLCPDCARAMGYAGSMSGRMSSWFNDDWFDRPFRMLEPFFGGFGSRMLTEFPQPVDVLEQAQSADPESPAKDDLLPHDEAMVSGAGAQAQRAASAAPQRRGGGAVRGCRPPAGRAEVPERQGLLKAAPHYITNRREVFLYV